MRLIRQWRRKDDEPCPYSFSGLGVEFRCLEVGQHRQHRDRYNNTWTYIE